MRELSLNVLDVVQNSVSAGADLIQVSQIHDTTDQTLLIIIEDNGCGMDEETVAQVINPFYTTRTTRKIGLGVPLFKMACEMTGGSLSITSQVGEGTRVEARFITSHIDMTPVGDMIETMVLLISCNLHINFVYTKTVDGRSYTMDTRQLREVLGDDVQLNDPEVILWMKEYLREQEASLAD